MSATGLSIPSPSPSSYHFRDQPGSNLQHHCHSTFHHHHFKTLVTELASLLCSSPEIVLTLDLQWIVLTAMTFSLDRISSLWHLYLLTNYLPLVWFPLICKLLLSSELLIPFSKTLSIFLSSHLFSFLFSLSAYFLFLFLTSIKNMKKLKMLKYITWIN